MEVIFVALLIVMFVPVRYVMMGMMIVTMLAILAFSSSFMGNAELKMAALGLMWVLSIVRHYM